MGIFKSLEGKVHDGTAESTSNQQNSTAINEQHQSQHYDSLSTKNEKRNLFGHSDDERTPSQSANPFRKQQKSATLDYSPPVGPPPSHISGSDKRGEFQPPPGPPPSQTEHQINPSDNPPPYHDWTVIPDTSLLPPPPSLPNEFSPTNNASYDSAALAHEWCAFNPLYQTAPPQEMIYKSVQSGDLTLQPPPGFQGTLNHLGTGRWRIRSQSAPLKQKTSSFGRWQPAQSQSTIQTEDLIFLTSLPTFFASQSLNNYADHPLLTERPKTIYFELKIIQLANANSGVAIGYASKPYPPWRLPGWHRASIGVHGDDGRRYVNDPWGGRDFVREFKVGDVVGLGINFLPEIVGGTGNATKIKTKVFFTRNGREEGGGWEMDEERDAERDEGVEGLMGEADMYPAIGMFGDVEVEATFLSQDWMYRL